MDSADKPGRQEPEDFLARWSRRKTEARAGAPGVDGGGAEAALPPVTEAAVPPARQPRQELTDADMPPVETLDADSDYAPFMSPGVSDGLRRKALRILFSQPACNITDGLNDYDEDYTRFAGLGNLVTHEMKRLLQRELEAEKRRLQEGRARTQASRAVAADDSVDPMPAQPDGDAGDAADLGET